MEKEAEVKEKTTNTEFIPESKENIIRGAKVFSERASEFFNSFMEKAKETAGTAYEKGSNLVENVTETAQNYIERYRDRSEMSSLEKIRDEVGSRLGYMCYKEYSGRYRIRQEFQKSREFSELMKQMRELDKQIIKIGERLEEEK